jgi:acyl-CoA hydrolase
MGAPKPEGDEEDVTDFSETEARIVEMVFPNHTNSQDQLFGGHALSLMDKLAFIVSSRYARLPMVTASSEKVDFLSPVLEGDLVEFIGRVPRVGRTSVRVGIEMFSEDLLSGERKLCTRGEFVMVAIDREGNPIPVPRAGA